MVGRKRLQGRQVRYFSVGDLVTDDFYEDLGIIISPPRLSSDCDLVKFGVMNGDVYEVVDLSLIHI